MWQTIKLKYTEWAAMLSRCLRTPVWPATATNGSYFLLRAMLQMLVSVVKLWSMSGALTGSGESPSLSFSLSLAFTVLPVWSDTGVRYPSCLPLPCGQLASTEFGWRDRSSWPSLSDKCSQCSVLHCKILIAAFAWSTAAHLSPWVIS